MNSNELKRMNKGFMRKDGKFFLPVTHESLVIDNNGVSVKDKYAKKVDLDAYATEDFVKDYVLKAQLGGEVDLSGYAKVDHNHDDVYIKHDDAVKALENKVDKEEGKSLVPDEEIAKLATLENYDDTEIKLMLTDKAAASHDHDERYAAKSFEHTHENKSVLDDITLVRMNTWDAKSDFSGSYNDLTDKPEIPSIEGLATQEFVETRIQEAAKPNFDFKIHMMPQDTEPYVTTTGEYPNFVVTFHIPSNNGAITPEPETLYMYYGRMSWQEIGEQLIQYSDITADMVKTAANVQKVKVSTMGKTSLGLESDTVMGDYCIIAVPTSKNLKVTRDNGFGGKTVFNEEDAGANGNVQLIIDNVQYDLYGELLIAPAEIFIYIDE